MSLLRKVRTPSILYLGDSITDDNFVSLDPNLPEDSIYKIKQSYKKWPDYITEFLSEHDGVEYTIMNGARCGVSIDFMFHMLMHCIGRYGDRIKYVFAGGTEFQRIYLYDFYRAWLSAKQFKNIDGFTLTGKVVSPQLFQWNLFDELPEGALGESKNTWFGYIKEMGYSEEIIEQPALFKHFCDDKTKSNINYKLGLMRAMRDICIANNIKFHWAQILPIFTDMLMTRRFQQNPETLKMWQDSRDHKLLKRENFMHFVSNEARDRDYFKKHWKDIPHFPWTGMTPMCPEPYWYGDIYDWETKKYWVSDRDGHPNKEGQKKLAEKIWKDYEKYKL